MYEHSCQGNKLNSTSAEDPFNFQFNSIFVSNSNLAEQPWPSSNALDSDQRGPRFEAHRRPLVTSGRHPVLNARARTKILIEAPSKPQ